ncbi:MAG: class I SAM-dependent methyltransferase [Methylobacteriaceae bacterium]|jgi:SAM-dependent methyltransferase|nr:class I SAM-dependent methyltransferase [Methylobacteriaceae bacterium]
MDPSAYVLMSETEDKHWWFRGRRAAITVLLDSLKLPAGAAICELGAGTGGNLALLKRYGTVSGLELDEYARDLACKKSGLDILPGKLPQDVPFADHSFDLVCLFDVLEHVHEDYETLVAIRRLLKPGGAVMITIPAYQWMWSAHDKVLHHFRRYSRTRFTELFTSAGYRAEKLSYFNLTLFPLAAVVRLMDRLLKREKSTGDQVPFGPINSLFAWITETEAQLLKTRNLPYGSSLVAILRVNEKW